MTVDRVGQTCLNFVSRANITSRGAGVDPQTPFPLSIVLPVSNESATLPGFLDSLEKYLQTDLAGVPVELVVLNNGSTDDTSKVANSLRSRWEQMGTGFVYREYPWGDYSEAVRRAVLLASGDRIAWLGVDIDDVRSIGRGLKALDSANADLVILSKYRGADWRPARRVVLNRAFNFLARVFDGLWYSDIEGYMIITSRVKPLFEALSFSRGNTINLNLLYFARRMGVRIVEAPLYVTEKRKSVFLRALPRLVWLDLRSVLAVHLEFKRFAGLMRHRHSSLRQP